MIGKETSFTLSTLTDEAICYPVIRPEIVMASTAEHAEMTDGRIAPCLMARAGTGGEPASHHLRQDRRND